MTAGRVAPDKLADLAESLERAESRLRAAESVVADGQRDETAARNAVNEARKLFDNALAGSWHYEGHYILTDSEPQVVIAERVSEANRGLIASAPTLRALVERLTDALDQMLRVDVADPGHVFTLAAQHNAIAALKAAGRKHEEFYEEQCRWCGPAKAVVAASAAPGCRYTSRYDAPACGAAATWGWKSVNTGRIYTACDQHHTEWLQENANCLENWTRARLP